MSDYELKRINALPEASAINDSDVFAIDSAAGTKKVAWETLKGEVDADISEAVSNKADKDGTYPDMAVGSVLGTNTVTDREPYFIRPSASIGDREFDTLVGGTLGWNQLYGLTRSQTSNKGLTIDVVNGVVSITGTSTDTGISVAFSWTNFTIEKGHVVLVTKDFALPSGDIIIDQYNGLSATADIIDKPYKVAQDTGYILPQLRIANSGVTYNITNGHLMVYDLTTLFGATIADYIYSLEQATAGAGVAWVRKYLPNTYYAYCAPTLKHVSGVSAHVMRDANNNVIGNYPIDSTWVGMGVPKLDSANKLYFDGDRYASDGTVTERFIESTITIESIYVRSENANCDFGVFAVPEKWAQGYQYFGTKTKKASKQYDAITDVGDVIIYDSNNKQLAVSVPKGYTLEQAKAMFDGSGFIYEKLTPTTSTASSYASPQICDPDGTEEYVTTGLVPVGHETEYVENLADKLTDIPDLPTTAGTYSLKVTVSGGVPSYSWVSA